MANAKKPGRPKAEIDWNRVDQMLRAQCNGTSIASSFGIDAETLYNRCKADNKMGFSEYSALKKAEGIDLIRMKQWEVAFKGRGDRAMLIFLGKVYAGQVEGTAVDLTTQGQPLTITPISFRPQNQPDEDNEE